MMCVLRRLPLMLLIMIDGAWWFVACLSIVAGWQYGYAGLHTRGVLLLWLLATLHFLLDIFPMRWLWRVTDSIYDGLFRPRTLSIPSRGKSLPHCAATHSVKEMPDHDTC